MSPDGSAALSALWNGGTYTVRVRVRVRAGVWVGVGVRVRVWKPA